MLANALTFFSYATATVAALTQKAMLSALLARLRHFGETVNAEEEQLQMLVPLMVSAFPDLRPWLVREAFSSRNAKGQHSEKQSNSNYYIYLSMLLDVDEGIDSARFEEGLVEVSDHTIFNIPSHDCVYFLSSNFSQSG